MVQFGIVTDNSCDYNLYSLISSKLPKGANAFYELYIQDKNGNLIDVPVLVSNFIDINNNNPNKVLDNTNSRLVHRFFISDTISGIESQGGYASNKTATIVRYPKSVKLRV
jgi:hypothetical protein